MASASHGEPAEITAAFIPQEGWLWKLGHRRRNWRRRYAYLRGMTVTYHSAPHSSGNTSKQLGWCAAVAGHFAMDACVVVVSMLF